MGCRSDYLEPSARETESARVREFLKEITLQPFDHDHPTPPYGSPATLDQDTDSLCCWCKISDVTKASLELQLWWKKHQEADRRRAEADEASAKAQRKRAAVLAGLTPDQKQILGL